MTLKRIYRPLFLFAVLLTFFCIWKYIHATFFSFSEAVARIRIQTQYLTDGTPLLLSQSKALTSQPVMEKVLEKIRLDSDLNQRFTNILELQRALHIEQLSHSEIFKVTFKNHEFSTASKILNLILKEFEQFDIEIQRRLFEEQHNKTVFEITRTLNHIQELEDMLQNAKSLTVPDSADEIFKKQIQEAETQLKNLRQTYTDNHPEIVELKSTLERLKAQLADAPPGVAGESVPDYRQELQKEIEKLQVLTSERDELVLKQGGVISRVQILQMASHPPRSEKAIPWRIFLIILALLAISLLLYRRR